LPAAIVNDGGDRLGKVQFSELLKHRDLDLGSGHTAYRHASLIDLIYTYQISLKSENTLWTYGRTDDVRTYTYLLTEISPSNVIRSTRRSRPKIHIGL